MVLPVDAEAVVAFGDDTEVEVVLGAGGSTIGVGCAERWEAQSAKRSNGMNSLRMLILRELA